MASRSVFSSLGAALPKMSSGRGGGARRRFSAALSRLATGGVKRKADSDAAGSAAKRAKYSSTAPGFSTTPQRPPVSGAPIHGHAGTSPSSLVAGKNMRRVHTSLAEATSSAHSGTSGENPEALWTGPEIAMASMLAAGTAGSFAMGAQRASDTGTTPENAVVSDGLEDFDWKERIRLGEDIVGPHRFPEVYNASVGALQGRRSGMEDDFYVGDGGRFVAVFDGHGGPGVSALLRDHLYDSFVFHLRQQRTSNVWAPTVASRVNALRAAFEEVGQEALKDSALQYEGSTACAIVLHEEENGERTLVSANVGDTRAILSRNGKAISLTRDHKPDDEFERQRIASMGEEITYDDIGMIYRVHNLAISRSIGDGFAKPAVTGEPEVKELPLAEDGDEFILVATDGLWDVMTNQEAVRYIHRKLRAARGATLEDRRKNLSYMIAKEAIRRGSVDNVCAAIVWLN